MRTPSLREETYRNCALLLYVLLPHQIEYALNLNRTGASVILNITGVLISPQPDQEGNKLQ